MFHFADLLRQVGRKKKRKAPEPVRDILHYTLPSVSWAGNTLENAVVAFPEIMEFAIWIDGQRVPFTPANYTDYGPAGETGSGEPLRKLLCYGVVFLVPEGVLEPFQRQLERMAQGVEDYYARHIGIDL